MKKTFIPFTLFVLFFSPLVLCAQNDWKKDKLLGKVKEVEENYYKGVEKFGEVEKDSKMFSVINVFDKEGYIVALDFEDPEDKEKTKRTWKYNSRHQPVEIKNLEDGELVLVKISYDQNGRQLEVDSYDKKGKLLEREKDKYDSVGRLKRADHYNGEGSRVWYEEHEYDNPGFAYVQWKKVEGQTKNKQENWVYFYSGDTTLSEEHRFAGKESMFKMNLSESEEDSFRGLPLLIVNPENQKETEMEIIKYYYNDKKWLTRQESTMNKNNVESRKTVKVFEYDKYGNLTLEKSSEDYYTVYTYTYDATGNWVKKVETRHSFGNLYHYLSERKIKYF